MGLSENKVIIPKSHCVSSCSSLWAIPVYIGTLVYLFFGQAHVFKSIFNQADFLCLTDCHLLWAMLSNDRSLAMVGPSKLTTSFVQISKNSTYMWQKIRYSRQVLWDLSSLKTVLVWWRRTGEDRMIRSLRSDFGSKCHQLCSCYHSDDPKNAQKRAQPE